MITHYNLHKTLEEGDIITVDDNQNKIRKGSFIFMGFTHCGGCRNYCRGNMRLKDIEFDLIKVKFDLIKVVCWNFDGNCPVIVSKFSEFFAEEEFII